MAASTSLAEVIRRLGRARNSNSYRVIRAHISRLSLDTSHFYTPPIDSRRRHWSEVLTLRSPEDPRQQSSTLRRALLASGRKPLCAACGLGSTWNGAPLVLEIDHINGKSWDDRKFNLRFLCPNCHSQAPTSRRPVRPTKHCLDCRKGVSKAALRCQTCNNRHLAIARTLSSKIEWPSTARLLQMLEESSFVQVGKALGVSDNAIRKRLRADGVDDSLLRRQKKSA